MPTRRALLRTAGAGLAASAVPLRYARALSPPYDFSTFTSTSRYKMFGGNILQAPNYVGLASQPNGDYQYGALFQQFSSGFNSWTNWIQPQIANFARRGANHVRCILGGDYVLQGTITQTALNTAINTIIADIRSRGMTVSFNMMAVQLLSDIGSPTAADQWVVSKSILDNCIVPNQDVVAYFEPGNQESRNADQGVEDAVCGLMKAGGYVCPIGVSGSGGGDFTAYTSANFDLKLLHNYMPEGSNYYETPRALIVLALRAPTGKKLLWEEFNIFPFGSAPNPGIMANCLEQQLQAMFGHPDVVGSIIWGGQSALGQSDGDFSLYTVPGSYNSQATDPTTVWTNNTAGTVYFLWGSKNTNQTLAITVNGTPTITTSRAPIQKNITTPIQGQVLVNQDLGTRFNETVPASCIGTFSISGTGGTTYRVSFGATNFDSSVWTELGHVDVVGSGTNVPINVSGTLADSIPWVINVQTQIVGGSTNGTLTAFNAVISYGLAPPANPTPFIRFG